MSLGGGLRFFAHGTNEGMFIHDKLHHNTKPIYPPAKRTARAKMINLFGTSLLYACAATNVLLFFYKCAYLGNRVTKSLLIDQKTYHGTQFYYPDAQLARLNELVKRNCFKLWFLFKIL